MSPGFSADTFVIVGLGNPGSEYAGTRHNFGFIVLDYFLHKVSSSSSFSFFEYAQAEIATVSLEDRPVVLVKPRTFMNNSGIAVRALWDRLQLDDLQQLLVVHDDLDLNLGRIKLKRGGGSGGHNGLKSLIEMLESADFLRLRLGVGGLYRKSALNTVDFVLTPFSHEEQCLVDDVKSRCVTGISTVVGAGIDSAMNFINRRVSDDP